MTGGTFAERRARLLADLAELPNLAVAFSGGVDSSVLLAAAHHVLGARAVGIIADSPSLPRRELREAQEVARTIGARLEIVRTDEGDDPAYRENKGDRCYFCKAALFRRMRSWCEAYGFQVMAFGEITDDAFDDRPGARAAREFRVVAPLSAAGLGKEDVRHYAREVGLDVAEKPASACLASRIPVGTEVTPARLATVEAAEEALRGLGLRELRVRHHGERARVEVGAGEVGFVNEQEAEIERALASFGFREVELAVYRSPSDRSREELSR